MKDTTTPKCVFSMLRPELGKAVAEAGYTTPTPIQEQAIPPLLKGRDVLGCAQTGTGKTAAFMLPILDYLMSQKRRAVPKKPQVLILAPTRELAAQISESALNYGRNTRITSTVVFGGVSQYSQVKTLRQGVHILVATPGRLLDLVQQRHIDLSAVEILVLDEADRMLDMGFMPDVKRILATVPTRRQSLFFSATMDDSMIELAKTMVHKPVRITIEPEKPAIERIEQKVMFVDASNKVDLLVGLLANDDFNRVLVFTQMKHVANRVEKKLESAGIKSASIHGNKSQTARTMALRNFKTGRVRALVATDIAARGIDVEGISHVINYDMPEDAETYIHRIGRTARAGADGDAISFCSARERDYLRAVEKLLRQTVPVDATHSLHCEISRNAEGSDARPLPRGRGRSRGQKSSAPRRGGNKSSSGSRNGGYKGPKRPQGGNRRRKLSCAR